jgi:Protein of unknown function (DUF3592)
MGMFKDMKDLHKMSKQYERPKMRDGIKQAKEGLEQVQADQAKADRLQTEGVDAEATVNMLEATGKTVNYQPEIRFDLTVNVNGFETKVNHVQVISPASLGQLQPGATVPVKVDPNDSSQVFIGL